MLITFACKLLSSVSQGEKHQELKAFQSVLPWTGDIFAFMNFQEIDDFGGEIGGNLVCEEIWVWQSCQESIRHTAAPPPLT